ncbi:MAG: hypothetical protein AAB215_00870, partial [Planctomycetota bacterium]
MEDFPALPPRRRHRWLLLTLASSIVLAVPVLLWLRYDWQSKKDLSDAIAESEALGPLDFRKLLAPAPPAPENGYEEARKATLLLRYSKEKMTEEERTLLADVWESGPGERENVRRIVEANRQALDDLRRGLDRPHIHFSMTVPEKKPLLEMLLPHIGEFREAGRFLSLCAFLEAESGDPSGAVED